MAAGDGEVPRTGDPCEDGMTRVLECLNEEPHGLSISDISRNIHLNRNSVAKYLGVLVTLGRVEMHTVGSAKVYRLSSRPSVFKVLDHVQDSMLLFDAGMQLRGINQAGCDRFNLCRENVVGRGVAEIQSPFLRVLVTSKEFSRAIRGTESFSDTMTDLEIGTVYLVFFMPVTLIGGQCGVAITLRAARRNPL